MFVSGVLSSWETRLTKETRCSARRRAVEREGGDRSGEENEEGEPDCPSEEIATVGHDGAPLVQRPHLPGADSGREGADGIG